jgi:hypothetical protein
MSATTTAVNVNGLKLMEAAGFDHRLAGSIIATRDNWQEILDSIPVSHQRRNVAAVVGAIRLSLGLDANYAFEISSGHQ